MTGAQADAASVPHYSNLYFFGDSITDSGVFAGLRFTTKPGNVWAENLGTHYGLPVSPAFTADLTPPVLAFALNASGNNFAVGDARINAAPPNKPAAANLPSAKIQVDGFLARGAVDSNALYAVWAGGNDVFAQFSSGAPLANGKANIETAAKDLIAQVTRLQSAGARNLVVLGIMDMTQSPSGLAMNSADSAQLNSLMSTFNSTLTAGLAGKNLLYFDMGKLNQQLLAQPLAYGFTDTTTAACGTVGALACQVAANGHLYADVRNPSTDLHQVIADWIYTSLEGASRVGQLSQVPLAHSSAQWRAIDGRLREFQNFGTQGQGFFVSGDYASSTLDAHSGLPSADGAGGSFVLGYEKSFSEQLFGGVTLGYGNAPFDLGNNQGTVKYDEWALSAFVSHKSGNFYANALTTYSWLDYASQRNIQIGSFSSSERGDTRGGQWGVKGQIGYNFVSGNLLQGPLVGLAWEQVKVDGFSEQSNSVTAMTFGEQSRQSLRSRLGWQVAAESHWAGVKVRPYAQLTYDYEHKKEEGSYRAGFVGGNTSLEIPMANRTGGYGTLLAGITAELSKTLRLGVGASTTVSQPGARNSALNVTLSAPF
jgi:outer membrane lipase/esterase